MRLRSAISNRPIAEAITTAASAAWAGACSRFGRRTSSSATATRADHAGELRLGAGRLGHRRARRAAADREALEEAGGEVGRAQPDHLLVGIDRLAERARRRRATARWCRRTTPAPPRMPPITTGTMSAAPIQRNGEGRQALRQRAEHGDAGVAAQIEHADDHRRADHGDQHAGHALAALEQQDDRERRRRRQRRPSSWSRRRTTAWPIAHRLRSGPSPRSRSRTAWAAG